MYLFQNLVNEISSKLLLLKHVFTRLSKFLSAFLRLKGLSLIARVDIHLHTSVLTLQALICI